MTTAEILNDRSANAHGLVYSKIGSEVNVLPHYMFSHS